MKTLLERIADLLPVLTLGALGGISRAIMSRKKDEPITLWGVLQEIIVAIFAGIVVHLLLSETGLCLGECQNGVGRAGGLLEPERPCAAPDVFPCKRQKHHKGR